MFFFFFFFFFFFCGKSEIAIASFAMLVVANKDSSEGRDVVGGVSFRFRRSLLERAVCVCVCVFGDVDPIPASSYQRKISYHLLA